MFAVWGGFTFLSNRNKLETVYPAKTKTLPRFISRLSSFFFSLRSPSLSLHPPLHLSLSLTPCSLCPHTLRPPPPTPSTPPPGSFQARLAVAMATLQEGGWVNREPQRPVSRPPSLGVRGRSEGTSTFTAKIPEWLNGRVEEGNGRDGSSEDRQIALNRKKIEFNSESRSLILTANTPTYVSHVRMGASSTCAIKEVWKSHRCVILMSALSFWSSVSQAIKLQWGQIV